MIATRAPARPKTCAPRSPRSSRPRPRRERTPTSRVRAERLANAEELRAAAAAAHEVLSGDGDVPDVGILLAESRRALERGHDPALDELAAQVADLGYRAADLAQSLAAYLADLDETGPARARRGRRPPGGARESDPHTRLARCRDRAARDRLGAAGRTRRRRRAHRAAHQRARCCGIRPGFRSGRR